MSAMPQSVTPSSPTPEQPSPDSASHGLDSPAVTPIAVREQDFAKITFNEDGLVAAIVTDIKTKDVLMMAWMNEESLQMSLEQGRTVFWSRSRQELWRKGDTSGDRQFIRSAAYDCDGDTLLFVVEQEGNGACHTGNYSCFFRAFGA
ncbi:phosphoribosyl-AMP cyclohydrolase [Actinobacteria bacterium IMCC26207]|nr:phosphoribosyl-AMP cyclohydrolase [Actinobacteria bacterium IMCC26207]